MTWLVERNSIMADFDEPLPEEADEQNRRLIHDLRRIYRTDTQTASAYWQTMIALRMTTRARSSTTRRQLYRKHGRVLGIQNKLVSLLPSKGRGNNVSACLRPPC